jgi:hypothetical protein
MSIGVMIAHALTDFPGAPGCRVAANRMIDETSRLTATRLTRRHWR